MKVLVRVLVCTGLALAAPADDQAADFLLGLQGGLLKNHYVTIPRIVARPMPLFGIEAGAGLGDHWAITLSAVTGYSREFDRTYHDEWEFNRWVGTLNTRLMIGERGHWYGRPFLALGIGASLLGYQYQRGGNYGWVISDIWPHLNLGAGIERMISPRAGLFLSGVWLFSSELREGPYWHGGVTFRL